jgi:hypothetical protein
LTIVVGFGRRSVKLDLPAEWISKRDAREWARGIECVKILLDRGKPLHIILQLLGL